MTRYLIIPLFLITTLAACAGSNASVKPTQPVDAMALYDHSIYEASVYKPAHILPLKIPAPGTIAVVTFTQVKYVDPLGPKTTGNDPIWITLSPEVQNICRTWKVDNLILRLEQLIGLPPNSGDTMMETFTIDSALLQRPCPDPNPTLPTCGNTLAPNLSQAYLQFFVSQTLGSYQVPNGYPWTHLGYTYDWNPGSSNHYGASEYIVPPSSPITVTSVQTAADFCKPN